MNHINYRPIISERDRNQEAFEVFEGDVLSVDIERKSLTVRDLRSGQTYVNVYRFPANHSSNDGHDVDMPEVGSLGACVHTNNVGGYSELVVLTWLVGDTNRTLQGIATRAVDIKDFGGFNLRKRGSYRKAWSGQKTVTRGEGYSEKQDDGWDRIAADFSRDRLDPLSRTHTQVTSARMDYTDAGFSVAGPTTRSGAAGLSAEMLPDGTTVATVYLQPGAKAADRYVSGAQDVIAFVERTSKIQEFALDYTVPAEILGSPLLETVLGVTSNPWTRTTVDSTGGVAHDDQTFMAEQSSDHPYHLGTKHVGSTISEGPTPQRRGYLIEKSEGTLVGSNFFDQSTYGKILKPSVFPYTRAGRFGADTESCYLSVNDSTDHAESRLAASAWSMRFPAEYNTTRLDITKEGALYFEVGSTLPKEKIQFAGGYEHPHGAGRSIEGNLTGSLKLVVGKNRDEEDAIDLQALGQTVLRLGADDSSLPNAGHESMTQIRGSKDAVQPRDLQYWTKAKLKPGDAGNLENKSGAENISLRAALDGGTVLRFGARNAKSLRRHLMNGYSDGPGRQAVAIGDPSRKDAKSPGRPTYGQGDSVYAFHDLTTAGKSPSGLSPYAWSGAPVNNMDQQGLSLDVHAVSDALLRVGANNGQSILLDTAGAIVAALGKDSNNRSITATLDGGVEMVIGMNKTGSALQIEFNGDVNWLVNGNFHLNVTGDTVFESTTHYHNVKTDIITKAQTITSAALVSHVTEAPNTTVNQGLYDTAALS